MPDSIAHVPVLAVFNLNTVPLTGHQQVQVTQKMPVVMFVLELGRDVIPIDMNLHYRLNIHSYSAVVAVPFFSSRADHIIALETINRLRTPFDGLLHLRHIIIIPIAKLMYHVGTAEKKETCCVVQWGDWGATGICRLPAPSLSLCCNAVSGSRFIPYPQSTDIIGVWDFSRAQARVSQLNTAASKEIAPPAGISGIVTTALSEDVIVIHEASIIASSIHLIYIKPIYNHRLSHPRGRRGFIFSSSKIPYASVKQVDNHLDVLAVWWSCISKKWSQRSTSPP